MNFARALAIAGRIVTQFRHDRRTMALIFIVPIFVMSLVGYLISEDKEPIPVAVVNLDQGGATPFGPAEFGTELVHELKKQSAITLKSYKNVADAEEAVRTGKVLGTVVLPRDLTRYVLSGRQVSFRVLLKGTDQTTDRIVRMTVGQALSDFAARKFGGASKPLLSINVESLYAVAELSSLDYFAPAFIVGFAFFFTFLLTSVSFLRERSSGTMERLAASPATKTEVMLGYLLGFLLFALIQSFLVMGYAVWVLHVHVAGSIWLALLILAVLVIGVVNLGIALSFLARNELQVIQFIPVVLIPQLFLGGLIWPVETLHPLLRMVSQIFPLTHAVAGLRDIMLGGRDFAVIQGRIYVLLAFAVLMAGFGALTLRKEQG